MGINPAMSSGLGQLKWINLKSISDKNTSISEYKSSEKSSTPFAAMIQAKTSESLGNEEIRNLSSFVDESSRSGLLWQQLGGTEETYSGTISGEIMETKYTNYEDLIQMASSKYGVPVDLIKAVIDTESSFNPDVVSSAGAKGLMQLMDGTANGLGVTNPFDPAQSIDGGVRYLSYQLERFDGQEKMALAAYNAGPGRVSKLGVSTDQELLEKLTQLPQETQSYISKIERARAQFTV